MEDLAIPKLTSEQIEALCTVAEEAARKYVLSKVSSKKIETLNVCAQAEGTKPATLTIDVDILLSPLMKDFDVQRLVDQAMEEAFESAKKYLKGLTCHSQK